MVSESEISTIPERGRLAEKAFPRLAPFALYMSFVGLQECLGFLCGKGVVCLPDQFVLWLYPVKALSVAVLICYFGKHYQEICFRELLKPAYTLVSIVTGITVFALWIRLDFTLPLVGNAQGFNPDILQSQSARIFMIAVRLSGAVLVVPVMEELFWRSFLIRYIIGQEFARIPIGTFTWTSFLISSLLFGFEHHLFLAGIIAGIAYNLLLYHTRSIAHCITAHAVTNLALGIYVISAGKWYLW